MSFDIILSLCALIPPFLAVMSIVVKINNTLTMLDSSVKQLKDFMEKQSKQNTNFGEKLSDHEKRLIHLEDYRKEN